MFESGDKTPLSVMLSVSDTKIISRRLLLSGLDGSSISWGRSMASDVPLVNERSKFFRGLSEKNYYERSVPTQPDSTRPMPTLLKGLYMRVE